LTIYIIYNLNWVNERPLTRKHSEYFTKIVQNKTALHVEPYKNFRLDN